MRRNSEKGFSLIELSIVLIIIGLLIAGITGGASLVKSATVRAVISEANSFNSAVNAYYAQFSNLPGDVNGNQNGRVEWVNTETTPVYEGTQAWVDLVNANIVEGSFSVSTDGTATPGTNIPVSKLSSSGWAMDFRNDMNMLVLSNPNGIDTSRTTELSSENVISQENASSIDTKMDDGTPNAGKVFAYTTTSTPAVADDPETIDVDESSPATSEGGVISAYDSSIRQPSCFMGFALTL